MSSVRFLFLGRPTELDDVFVNSEQGEKVGTFTC